MSTVWALLAAVDVLAKFLKGGSIGKLYASRVERHTCGE